MVKKLFTKYRQIFILIIISFVFFFLYSYLSLTTPAIFNSPDETANFVFIRQFAQTGQLKISEPLNQIAGNIIHPRSANVTPASPAGGPAGDLVPGGFLGLILIYGFLAKIFGLWIVEFLTPFFAVVSVLFFYGLIKKIFTPPQFLREINNEPQQKPQAASLDIRQSKRIFFETGAGFDEKIAFLSAVLLFINPAWWYYASRGLLPNVLFISLLIIAFYFLLNYRINSTVIPAKAGIHSNRRPFFLKWIPSPRSESRTSFAGMTLRENGSWALAGLFFGLALSVRLIDALWLLPVLIILFLFNKKRDWRAIILFITAFVIALLPAFYYQQATYGSAWQSGYNALETGAAGNDNFFPFGFHPRLALKNFFDYYAKFFWWLFLPALGGLVLLLRKYKEISKQQKIFLWLGGLISLFLIIYYGSGIFNDNPTPWRTTIGDSHVRYWLLVYVFSLPLMAYFLLHLKILSVIPAQAGIQPTRDRLSIIVDSRFRGNDGKRGGKGRKKFGLIVLLLIWLIIIYFSCFAVLWRDEEGLLAIKNNLADYANRRQIVKEMTAEESIIIVQRGDKLFWPSRRVINLNDWLAKPEVWPLLAERVPLYGYFLFSEQELADFSQILAGYKIEKIKDFEDNEDLYKINK